MITNNQERNNESRWIEVDGSYVCEKCECDAPIYMVDWKYVETKTKWCPNCGRKMKNGNSR